MALYSIGVMKLETLGKTVVFALSVRFDHFY